MMSEQPNMHSEGGNTPLTKGYAANDIPCPSNVDADDGDEMDDFDSSE